MRAREGGGGEHLDRRVDVHVVLLGAVVEVLDAGHHRVVRPGHLDPVVDDVAGVRDPLAAAHELVARRGAKGIRHAAVVAAEPDAALDRAAQIVELGPLDRRHGADRHDQGELVQRRIGERGGCRVSTAHGEARLAQQAGDDLRACLGLVPLPAAPHHQRLLLDLGHLCPPSLTPARRPRGRVPARAGRATRLATATMPAPSLERTSASITSST